MYHDEPLYISFDEGAVVDEGEFLFEQQQLAFILSEGPINNAFCFSADNEMTIGTLTSQCISDFTHCENGFAINFWISVGNHSEYDKILEVLSIGDVKLSITFHEDIHSSPTGYVEWKQEECSYTFDLPVESWLFISIHINQMSMEIYFNGLRYHPLQQCEVPTLVNSVSAVVKVGEVPFCLDDLSVIKMNDAVDLGSLYYKLLTGSVVHMFLVFRYHLTERYQYSSFHFFERENYPPR